MSEQQGAADNSSAAASLDVSSGLTFDQATARKAEIAKQPGFVDRWLNGDLAARKEVDAINAVLANGAPDPNKILRAALIDTTRTTLKPHHVDEFVSGSPVTQAIHDEAVALKSTLMRDRAFLQRWYDGDREALQKIELLSLVLAQPIKD